MLRISFHDASLKCEGGKGRGNNFEKTEGVLSRTSCNQQVRLQTIAQCLPPSSSTTPSPMAIFPTNHQTLVSIGDYQGSCPKWEIF